jgi:prevent-host-death family protein
MASWRVAEAKAKFSEVLDKAEHEGPQLVRRKAREFYVLTREQLESRTPTAPSEPKPFVSAWDALRPSFDDRYDVEFPRATGTARTDPGKLSEFFARSPLRESGITIHRAKLEPRHVEY